MFGLDDIDFSAIPPVPAVTAAVLVLFAVWLIASKRKGIPPGPTGIPYFGYYPFLDNKKYYLQLQELAKKYGDVFSFTVTGKLYIHINTTKALREAHVTNADSLNSRTTTFNIMKHAFGTGVAYATGEQWKVLRRFFIVNLKEFGLSSFKGNLAAPVSDSLSAVIEEIRGLKGAAFDFTSILMKCCTTTMRQLLFCGVPIAQEDVDAMMSSYAHHMKPLEGKAILLSGALVEHVILPFCSFYKQMVTGKSTMDKILLKIIRDHKSTLNEDHPRDIVDCFLIEKKALSRKGDPTSRYFTEEALLGSLTQLVGDMSIGVGFFIATFLQDIASNPDVQEKIYAEVLEIIGGDRLPTGEDKSRMPYTNSVIHEMVRCINVFPAFPTRECTKDMTLNGYTIPKDSVTLVNNWSIQHDELVYEDPYTFNAERFITKPGKPRAELPTLFGVGRRSCAGETFVMMQTFLFLVTIVKNFKLSPSTADDKSYIERKLCAQPRS